MEYAILSFTTDNRILTASGYQDLPAVERHIDDRLVSCLNHREGSGTIGYRRLLIVRSDLEQVTMAFTPMFSRPEQSSFVPVTEVDRTVWRRWQAVRS